MVMKKAIFTILSLGIFVFGYSQADTISNNIYQNDGRLGIGTNDPQIKLHIKDSTGQHYLGYQKAYDGPYINMIGKTAGQTPMFGLGLAQKDYIYYGDTLCYKDWAYLYGNEYNKGIAIIPDLIQAPGGLYVNKYGSVGIGVEVPEAKLQVADGDIYISDIEKGIIMKSPDGNCWRGTLDNSGQLGFTSIDCPDDIVMNSLQQTKSSENILVFPNPSDNNINIDLGESFIKNQKYSVFNLSGQLIEGGKIKSAIYTIDISKYEPGVYLLKIDDKKGNDLISKNIVKK